MHVSFSTEVRKHLHLGQAETGYIFMSSIDA